MQWYNFERKHRSLGRMTPQQKWATGLSCSTDKQRDQVAGSACQGRMMPLKIK